MLETLDYTLRIGITPTFLYFDLYLYSVTLAEKKHVPQDSLTTIQNVLKVVACCFVKTTACTSFVKPCFCKPLLSLAFASLGLSLAWLGVNVMRLHLHKPAAKD